MIIFPIQQHLSSFLPKGIPMLQALQRPFCLQPLVESNQGWQKQKIQESGPCGQEKSVLKSNVVSAGTFCTAGAMPQHLLAKLYTEWKVASLLILSLSHHWDNKDVCRDRSVAIWPRAVLRVLLRYCSSLPRSLGCTRLGVRSIWQCCPARCCPSLPNASKKPPCSCSPSPHCAWMHQNRPAFASVVIQESPLQPFHSHFKYFFKAIGLAAFK